MHLFRRQRTSLVGFTLVELLVVVAAMGILAAISLPKFADMVIKAREAKVRAELGAIRSAVSIYYADIEFFPDLTGSPYALVPTYINKLKPLVVPAVRSNPGHPAYGSVTFLINCGSVSDFTLYGSYSYCRSDGAVCVACTHPDSRGVIWSIQ